MIRRLSILSFALAVLCPALARAEESRGSIGDACLYPFRAVFRPGTACIRDSMCEGIQRCLGGYCRVPEGGESSQAPPAEREQARAFEPPAVGPESIQCAPGDRRCRIERLKRRQRARRLVGQLKQERIAARIVAERDRVERESVRRALDPWRFSFVGDLLTGGLALSYTVAQGRVQIEGLAANIASYYDTPQSEASIEGWLFGASASYLFTTGWLSPYLGAGFQIGAPSYDSFSFDGFFGEGGDQGEARIHMLRAQAGFDMQFSFGFSARLGAILRQPIYTQIRLGPGRYDRQARESFDRWLAEEWRVSPEFTLGWAF